MSKMEKKSKGRGAKREKKKDEKRDKSSEKMRTKYSQMYYGIESLKSPDELLANGGMPAALETVPLSSKNTPPVTEHSIPPPYRHCEPPFNLSSAKERQSREKEESGQEEAWRP